MIPKDGIYTPLQSDGYELCHPVAHQDFETINVAVNGISRQSNWVPIPMRLIHDDEGQNLVMSDSPWLGPHALIFRPNVVEALGSMLQHYGELLPLACEDGEVLLYNPTRVIDALDESASSVMRFSGGRIMMIHRYVLRPNVVGDTDIFRIPNLRVSPTFLSHRFIERRPIRDASPGDTGGVFQCRENSTWRTWLDVRFADELVIAAGAMMSASNQVGRERTRLNFADVASESFAFLRELGFGQVESLPTIVRYRKEDHEVAIHHGRQSFEISFEVTRSGNRYSISELIRAAEPEAAERYRNYAATTPEGIAKILRGWKIW